MKRKLKQWSESKSKNEMTETKAMLIAKEKLDTFEGNLKAEHTETHFVFKKIRG